VILYLVIFHEVFVFFIPVVCAIVLGEMEIFGMQDGPMGWRRLVLCAQADITCSPSEEVDLTLGIEVTHPPC
jgi:hypothetical protein